MEDLGRTLKRRGLALASSALAFVAVSGAVLHGAPAPLRQSSRSAPAFTLMDLSGRARSLTDWRGRSVALFFFCGCDPCHNVADLWSQTPGVGEPGGSATVVIFSGSAAEARVFAEHTHLKASRAVLLLDPQERVADRYGVDVCPRVFVLDPARAVRYTNNEPGSNPQTTATISIVSRALTALQAVAPKSAREDVQHAR